jgi:hypothetical protein
VNVKKWQVAAGWCCFTRSQEDAEDSGCRSGIGDQAEQGDHMKKKGRIGSSFDDFLKEDGIYALPAGLWCAFGLGCVVSAGRINAQAPLLASQRKTPRGAIAVCGNRVVRHASHNPSAYADGVVAQAARRGSGTSA